MRETDGQSLRVIRGCGGYSGYNNGDDIHTPGRTACQGLMSFRSGLESLINALANGEEEEAVVRARHLLANYPPEAYSSLSIDELLPAFSQSFKGCELHRALSSIICKALINVDFSSFCEKYDALIRENARLPAIRHLFPQVIDTLVPSKCSPQQLVQSRVFPFMLFHLSSPDSELSSHEEMESALLDLVAKDPEVVFLIFKVLTILPTNDDAAVARIVYLKLNIAIAAKSSVLVKTICLSPLFEVSQSSDVVLIAGLIQTATIRMNKSYQQSPSPMTFLEDGGFVGKVIESIGVDDSLVDISIEFLICYATRSDTSFCEKIAALFDTHSFDPSRHPIVLQMNALIFKYSENREDMAEAVHAAATCETGARQFNALQAINLLIADDHSIEKQRSFFATIFPNIFDFISQQIPLKGDLQVRLALYNLSRNLILKDWIIPDLLKSKTFLNFLLDRSSDSSVMGLNEKFEIVKALSALEQTPSELKSKLSRYRAEGIRGDNPIVSMDSRTDL